MHPIGVHWFRRNRLNFKRKTDKITARINSLDLATGLNAPRHKFNRPVKVIISLHMPIRVSSVAGADCGDIAHLFGIAVVKYMIVEIAAPNGIVACDVYFARDEVILLRQLTSERESNLRGVNTSQVACLRR